MAKMLPLMMKLAMPVSPYPNPPRYALPLRKLVVSHRNGKRIAMRVHVKRAQKCAAP